MKVARILLMVAIAVLVAAQMAGAVYVTSYSEDFGSDPGYDSQDSTNVYWDSGQENYYAKSFDVGSGYGNHMAYSPEFSLVEVSRDFRVQFDFMIITPDWGCYPGVTFQNTLIPDSNPLMPDGNTFSFHANYHWDDHDVRKFRLRSDGAQLFTPAEPTAGEWFTFKIQYHAGTQTVDWVIEDDLGLVWYEDYGLAFPGAADFNRLYIGEITQPPLYGDESDIRVDNITVSALVSPYMVDCAGGGDFLNIQDAIDVASDGDTVLVAPCVYTGAGNRNLDFGGTNIVLRSLEGPDNTIIDCENADWGFNIHSGEDSTCVIEGLTITRGADVGGNNGGAMAIYGEPHASPTIRSCRFVDNGGVTHGGALYIDGGNGGGYARPHFSDCLFVGNSAGLGGGAYLTWYSDAKFVRCTFSGNSGGGGGAWLWSCTAEFDHCTFSGNTSGIQGGTHDVGAHPVLKNTIVAFSTSGPAVSISGGASTATLTCCDLYGNAGGDWEGDIADQLGEDGNISDDPLFCDAAGGVFTVSTDSPCASWGNPGCGQIGAFGVGCEAEVPVITTITDVGNDQGRWVRLHWLRSMYDAAGSAFDVTGYGIYRRQDEYMRSTPDESQASLDGVVERGGVRLDGWDYIDWIPARGDEAYQFVAPTLCDSTEQGGICWSVFMVSAMTPDGMVYFDSRPDSGYSIDNLAPAAPAVARGEFDSGAGDITISWSPTESEDLAYYEVFCGQGCDFVPDESTWIGDTADTVFVDSSLGWDDGSCYKVAAVDYAGNRSEYAEVWAYDTGVPDDEELDKTVVQNSPNPFSPAGGPTEIQYSVPASGGAVRIAVYDLSGHLVRELVDQDMPAGTHSVFWNGMDSRGRSVAAGVYFYRFDAPGVAEQRKMIVLK